MRPRQQSALFGSSGLLAGAGGAVRAGFDLGSSLLILIVATSLMGATLPLLARYAVRRDSEIGARVGGLYAANTPVAVAALRVVEDLPPGEDRERLRALFWLGASR